MSARRTECRDLLVRMPGETRSRLYPERLLGVEAVKQDLPDRRLAAPGYSGQSAWEKMGTRPEIHTDVFQRAGSLSVARLPLCSSGFVRCVRVCRSAEKEEEVGGRDGLEMEAIVEARLFWKPGTSRTQGPSGTNVRRLEYDTLLDMLAKTMLILRVAFAIPFHEVWPQDQAGPLRRMASVLPRLQ